MILIHQKQLLEEYYNQFPLSDYFSFDISPYTSIVKFDSGENIFYEGEQPDSLCFLISGRAKLFLSHENGRISLINFLNAPCFAGEMELLGAQENANGQKFVLNAALSILLVKETNSSQYPFT